MEQKIFILVVSFISLELYAMEQRLGTEEFQRGHQHGYQDAIEGVPSWCNKYHKCISQHEYERGYKLGFEKGFREWKKQNEFVTPLIDSPGKTIGSDFNGDGIHDILLGARTKDFTRNGSFQTDVGAVYVVFGATTIAGTKNFGTAGGGSAAPDVTFIGRIGGDLFGRSVSSAGDVNGDGIDDIIIGANANDSSDTDAGAAYIFFGSTTLSGTKDIGGLSNPDVSILGKATLDHLGRSVAGVGDVNGDGFDDLLIGAPTSTSVGKAAYLFYGAANLSGTKDMKGTFTPGASADVSFFDGGAGALGIYLSAAGDVNGDGFDDLLLGAHTEGTEAALAGAAYVVYGASNLSGSYIKNIKSPDVTFLGPTSADYLGRGVSAAGDVNGDGFDDIMIGVPQGPIGGVTPGIVYVVFGFSSLSGTKRTIFGNNIDVTFAGRTDGDGGLFGRYLSNIGDVNDDGFDDMIVGVPLADESANNAGQVHLFFGSSTLSGNKDLSGTLAGPRASSDFTIVGKAANDYLGRNVSGAGDVNADGIPDFIMGADAGDDPGGGLTVSDGGHVYVIFGSATWLQGKTFNLATGTGAPDVTIYGQASGDNMGSNLGGGRGFSGP